MDAGLPRCSAPQEGHLLSIYTGPELVLPGTAMRPSCHTNYTAVTTCRGTVRPRTPSVLRALRPLPSIRAVRVLSLPGHFPSYVAISSKEAPLSRRLLASPYLNLSGRICCFITRGFSNEKLEFAGHLKYIPQELSCKT